MKVAVASQALFFILCCLTVVGQTEKKSNGVTELTIGEKMKDISFGITLNNKTGKQKFSEFQGKLIILDFWQTWCKGCLKSFPKLSELQRKYKDQVQILLVNPYETKDVIEEHIKKVGRNYLPDNLIVLTSANELGQLFPSKFEIGYHVWIDTSGVVIQRGISKNTSSETIRDYFAGKPIRFVRELHKSDFLDKSSIFSKIQKATDSVVKFGSIVTGYLDEFWGPNPKRIHDDNEATKTKRNTYINETALSLFNIATSSQRTETTIWGVTELLFISDTAKRELIYGDNMPAINSRHCYEQIVPISCSDSLCEAIMLDDLNRFFGQAYGIIGSIEEKIMPCFSLIKIHDADNLVLTNAASPPLKRDTTVAGKRYYRFKNYPVDGLFSSITDPQIRSEIPILINRTGYSRISITLPRGISSLTEMRKVLHNHGLDIIYGNFAVKVLVFKEVLRK